MDDLEEIQIHRLGFDGITLTIITLMIDPARGTYLAFTPQNLNWQAKSAHSRQEAIGALILNITQEE